VRSSDLSSQRRRCSSPSSQKPISAVANPWAERPRKSATIVFTDVEPTA
jgi:hypothetical protein